MIIHMVLLKLRFGVDIDGLAKEIDAMAQKIPDILSISIGGNVSPEDLDKGFNFGFVVNFKDVIARDSYLQHPEHLNVAKQIESAMEDIIVFDILT